MPAERMQSSDFLGVSRASRGSRGSRHSGTSGASGAPGDPDASPGFGGGAAPPTRRSSSRGSGGSGSRWLRAHAGSPLLRGALEALLVPLAFVALGLAWWPMRPIEASPTAPVYAEAAMSSLETSVSDPKGLESSERPDGLPSERAAVTVERSSQGPPSAQAAPATPEVSAASEERPEEWLVDGFNVVQVGLLRDRDREGWWSRERRRELMARAERFERPRVVTWVVFDGPEEGIRSEASGRLHEVYAASADDWLAARVRAAAEPSRIVVVTADRRLANRVRHHGGRVVAPAEFLRACGPLEVRSV